MSQPLRVLLLEDNENDAMLVVRQLRKAEFEPECQREQDPEAMAEALEKHRFDVILSDFSMPQFTAIDGLGIMRKAGIDLPFIIISGTVGEETAVAAMKAGAHDYLMKGHLMRLGEAVRREIAAAEGRRRRRRAEQQLEHVNQVLRAIRSINQLIVREKDPAALLEQACETLVALRGYAGAWIAVGSDDGAPSLFAQAGFGRRFEPMAQQLTGGQWPVCRDEARANGDGLAVLDPRTSCQACPLGDCYDRSTALVTSLPHGEDHLGIVGVALPHGLVVDDSERSLLLEVAGDVAFALHDIETERQRSRYAQIVASSSEAMALVDGRYRYLVANPSYRRLVGWAEIDVVGRAVREVLGDSAFDDNAKPNLDRCLAGEEVRFETTRAVPGSGRSFLEAIYTPCVARDGSVSAAAICIRDVTDQRHAEQRIRLLSEMVEQTPDAILCTDPDYRITYLNKAAEELFGWSLDELRGRRPDVLNAEPQAPEMQRAIYDQVAQGEVFQGEARNCRKDGTVFDCQFWVAPIRDEQGQVTAYMGSQRDITERMRLQMQIAQADRLASMGTLAAGVAHEINNPLSYVLYNLESLTEDLPSLLDAVSSCQRRFQEALGAERYAELVGEAEPMFAAGELGDLQGRFEDALTGASRIREIARGLGSFSRVERDELAPVDIPHVLDAVAHMASNEIKYRARLVKDHGPVPPVMASEGRLSQVFLNLLINAAHAIDEGDVASNEIRIRTWADGDQVCAEVSDTGSGIAPEHLDKLFEPFFSTKKLGVGSGLGLAISMNIVNSYGGTIDVRSEFGQGATFTVRLPATEEPAAEVGPPSRAASEVPLRGRILVVDDENNVRAALMRILRQHDTVEAASGAEAKRILAGDSKFDVILCDVMMSDVSGMELHQWLAATNEQLARRLVFITGGAFTPKSRDYLASVDALRLEKPFEPKVLRRVVADRLRETRGRPR